jgi:phosphoglucosamine mutase
VPQLLRNVRFGEGRPLESPLVQRTIKDGETRLGSEGRLVIRESGTEPVIRVMAEGEDEVLVTAIVNEICSTLLAASSNIEDLHPRLPRLGEAQAAE